MGEFFGSIYCWFENVFGLELADYLWGISSPLSQTNQFFCIGISMFIISVLLVWIFYYAVNHPWLNHWWGWVIFLVANAIINFIIGWSSVQNDYYAGKMVTIDPATQMQTPLNINGFDIFMFGISNVILSILVFFIFSILLKWWSTNCSRAPFVR